MIMRSRRHLTGRDTAIHIEEEAKVNDTAILRKESCGTVTLNVFVWSELDLIPSTTEQSSTISGRNVDYTYI